MFIFFILVVLILLATSVWAAVDAGTLVRFGVPKKDLGGGSTVVCFCGLLLWIIAFPYYLAKRSTAKHW